MGEGEEAYVRIVHIVLLCLAPISLFAASLGLYVLSLIHKHAPSIAQLPSIRMNMLIFIGDLFVVTFLCVRIVIELSEVDLGDVWYVSFLIELAASVMIALSVAAISLDCHLFVLKRRAVGVISPSDSVFKIRRYYVPVVAGTSVFVLALMLVFGYVFWQEGDVEWDYYPYVILVVSAVVYCLAVSIAMVITVRRTRKATEKHQSHRSGGSDNLLHRRKSAVLIMRLLIYPIYLAIAQTLFIIQSLVPLDTEIPDLLADFFLIMQAVVFTFAFFRNPATVTAMAQPEMPAWVRRIAFRFRLTDQGQPYSTEGQSKDDQPLVHQSHVHDKFIL